MPYTKLPFELETDASNEVELVTPPFLLQTINDRDPVPNPAEVEKAVGLAEAALEEVRASADERDDLPLSTFLSMLKSSVGVEFEADERVDVRSEHISMKSEQKPGKLRLEKMRIVAPKKHRGKIATQVNLATNARLLYKLGSRHRRAPASATRPASERSRV